MTMRLDRQRDSCRHYHCGAVWRDGCCTISTSGVHHVTSLTPVEQDGEVAKGHPQLAGSLMVPEPHVCVAEHGGRLQHHNEAWCMPRGRG